MYKENGLKEAGTIVRLKHSKVVNVENVEQT